jgi:microsomal dipeptidase-like Zn-dependent dipeptidase
MSRNQTSLNNSTLEKASKCIESKFSTHDTSTTKYHLIKFHSRIFPVLFFLCSALSSNGGVLSIDFDKLTVKEAIHNINYVRALAGLDHVGLGSTSSPKKYALLLAELARDRLWNNASLKKLVGGNIVRILREVWID